MFLNNVDETLSKIAHFPLYRLPSVPSRCSAFIGIRMMQYCRLGLAVVPLPHNRSLCVSVYCRYKHGSVVVFLMLSFHNTGSSFYHSCAGCFLYLDKFILSSVTRQKCFPIVLTLCALQLYLIFHCVDVQRISLTRLVK